MKLINAKHKTKTQSLFTLGCRRWFISVAKSLSSHICQQTFRNERKLGPIYAEKQKWTNSQYMYESNTHSLTIATAYFRFAWPKAHLMIALTQS